MCPLQRGKLKQDWKKEKAIRWMVDLEEIKSSENGSQPWRGNLLVGSRGQRCRMTKLAELIYVIGTWQPMIRCRLADSGWDTNGRAIGGLSISRRNQGPYTGQGPYQGDMR